MAWPPNDEDRRNVEKTEFFLRVRGIRPGYRFEDKRDGTCVFSRIGATGKMVCHPLGEPDMQSSWVWSPEDFAKHVLDEVQEPAQEPAQTTEVEKPDKPIIG